MSWGVSGIGRPAALAAKLAVDFAGIHKMEEPEQTGMEAAAKAVAAIVPAFPKTSLVRVECNGSQYTPDSGKAPTEKINQLTIKIESMGTLVE